MSDRRPLTLPSPRKRGKGTLPHPLKRERAGVRVGEVDVKSVIYFHETQ